MYILNFFPEKCYVKNQDTNQILLQGKIKDGFYVFPALQSSTSYSVNTTSVDPDKNVLHLWHSRQGHSAYNTIQQILKECNIHCPKHRQFCHSCVVGKAHQLPFQSSDTVYTKPLQLVYVDI